MSAEPASPAIRQHKAKWREVVLVCRKCTKKVRGGFGAKGRKSLRKALREELDLPKGRRSPIAVIEVGCFGVCPKKAVTAFSSARPELLQTIPPKTPMAEVVQALGLSSFEPPTLAESEHAP